MRGEVSVLLASSSSSFSSPASSCSLLSWRLLPRGRPFAPAGPFPPAAFRGCCSPSPSPSRHIVDSAVGPSCSSFAEPGCLCLALFSRAALVAIWGLVGVPLSHEDLVEANKGLVQKAGAATCHSGVLQLS